MEPSHVTFNENGNPIPVLKNNIKKNGNNVNAANANANAANGNVYNNANAANVYNNANAANNNSNPLVRHFQTTHETPGYGSHVKFGNNGNATVLRIGPVTINPKGIRSNYKGTHVKFNNTPNAAAPVPSNIYEVLLNPERYGYKGVPVSWANITEPGFNISQLKIRSNDEIKRYKEMMSKTLNRRQDNAAEKQEIAAKAQATLEAAEAEIAQKEREAAKAAYEAHVATMAAAREAELDRQRERAAIVEFSLDGENLTKTVRGAPAKLWYGVPTDADEFATHQKLRDDVILKAKKQGYINRGRGNFKPGPGKKAPLVNGFAKAINIPNNYNRLSTVSDDMINIHCTHEHREGVCYRDLYWRMGQMKQHFNDCAHAIEGHQLASEFKDNAGLMEHYQGVIEGQFIARTKGKGKKEDLVNGCGYVHYYESPYTFQGVSYEPLPHDSTIMPDPSVLYGQALLEYSIARDVVEPGEEDQAGGRRRRRTTRKVCKAHRRTTRTVHRKKTHRKH